MTRKRVLSPQSLLTKKASKLFRLKPERILIAVKVVDNDGLENVEIIKLKINGAVDRLNRLI
ncbi:MAG: hypothetical protein LBB48_02050 [Treponema sp.]|jgi:hypothetical protein|nr:hypothetical protein [Treponema sp.]